MVMSEKFGSHLKEISKKLPPFSLEMGTMSIFILNYWLTRGCLEIDAVWLKIFNLKFKKTRQG